MAVSDTVVCTSAEFNGSEYDGYPFDPHPVPDWFRAAVSMGKIWWAPSAADYASYWVKTRDGVSFASAGDTIVLEPDWSLSVRETGHWDAWMRLKWDPALWGPAPPSP